MASGFDTEDREDLWAAVGKRASEVDVVDAEDSLQTDSVGFEDSLQGGIRLAGVRTDLVVPHTVPPDHEDALDALHPS